MSVNPEPGAVKSGVVETGWARGHAWLNRRRRRRGMSEDEWRLERAIERRSKPRRERGVRLRCVAHPTPVTFQTRAAFNEHLREHVTADSGPVLPVKAPARTRRAAARRPPNRPAAARDRLEALVAAWQPQINRIREEAVSSMNLTGVTSALKEFGETAPKGVSDLRERLVAIEQLGQALQESMDGVATRWRTDAHIDEEVTAELRPLEEAGEMITSAATRTLAAFEDRYRDDIRKAQAEERVENQFLVR